MRAVIYARRLFASCKNNHPRCSPNLRHLKHLSVLDGHIRGQVFSTLVQMQVADTIEELGIASTTLLEKLTELLDWPHWQVRIKGGPGVRANSPEHP